MFDRPGHESIVQSLQTPRTAKSHIIPKEHTITSIQDTISSPLERINRELETHIQDAGLGGDLSVGLRAAMEYAVLGGGKRLRPLLVWHACAAVGGDPEDCLPAAASIEYIHAFSLVHDDLPAMDDDDLRRGKPTLHIHTTQAMAILAGDALLNLAYAVLPRSYPDPAQCCALVQEVAIGCAGMISGQVYDTLPEVDPPIQDSKRLDRIHRNKTGALIRAACRIGAICGNASPANLDSITTYAEDIGLMFQAIDDLIDVEQHAEHTGKRTGKDAEAGKLTYPGLLGIEGTRAEVKRLRDEAVKSVEPMGKKAMILISIAELMASRDR